jgi:hypothetical protein
MNQRIFKLALEAMDFQGAIDTDTELKLTNSELEKFAELIVRECADQVDWILAEGGKTQGDLIREHFGVEP